MKNNAKRILAALSGMTLLSISTLSQAIPDGEVQGIPFGSGYFYPSLGLELIYDDNMYLQETNEQGSWLIVISPRATLEYEGEASELLFDLEIDHGTYEANSDDNFLDARLEAEAAYYPTERLSLYGDLGISKEHEARGTGNTSGSSAFFFDEPDEYREWFVSGRVKYGLEATGAPSVELEAIHNDRKYTNNRTATQWQDRETDQLKATFFYNIAPATSLLLEGTVKDIEYDLGELDSDQYRLLAGLTWEATYQTTGFLKLGASEKKFKFPGHEDGSEASWEVGIEWEPLSYSDFTLSMSRDFEESDGVGDYIDRNGISLEWNHDWYSYFGHTVTLVGQKDKYGGINREDDLWSLELKANYRARSWLLLGVGFLHTENDSNVAGESYVDNVIRFQAGINM